MVSCAFIARITTSPEVIFASAGVETAGIDNLTSSRAD
ncbi:hypothetical protein Pd630_LPD16166 (plasmid) [Rhodococcus opacus PD630]|nr:hypothetical protein Pd630_LPD16166 [Rhodococcus opacus PD630]